MVLFRTFILTDRNANHITQLKQIINVDLKNYPDESAIVNAILEHFSDSYSTPEEAAKVILDMLNFRESKK